MAGEKGKESKEAPEVEEMSEALVEEPPQPKTSELLKLLWPYVRSDIVLLVSATRREHGTGELAGCRACAAVRPPPAARRAAQCTASRTSIADALPSLTHSPRPRPWMALTTAAAPAGGWPGGPLAGVVLECHDAAPN